MSIFKGFLGGLGVGAAATAFALSYHVVHTDDGLILVSRSQKAPWRSTYVDVRKWSGSMWQQYPEVSSALAQSGRGDLLLEGVADGLLEDVLPSAPLFGPTAQAPEQVVPIRFVDPQGQPLPNPDPSPINARTSASPAIPWDEFLKGASERVVPDPQTSAIQRDTATPPAAAAPITPTGTPFIPVTAMNLEGDVLPELFRQTSTSQKVETLTDSFASYMQQESENALQNLTQSTAATSAPEVLQPLSINPTTEAPNREWVQGLLQSLIPESTIPAASGSANLPSSLLDAPRPSLGNNPESMIYNTLVNPPSRAVRPF